MTNYFIIEDISNLVSNASGMLEKNISSISDNETAKPYFIYSYSIFESTITEIIRYYLRAFPYKIDKSITVNKEDLLSFSRTSEVIEIMIDQNIRKYSSKALYEYIQFFIELQDLKMSISKYDINEISSLRNEIIHDNIKNTLKEKYNNKNSISDKNQKPYKEYIYHLIYFLKEYNKCVSAKYSEYNLDKLVRTIWGETFFTTLLPFDDVWEYDVSGCLQFKDIHDLKRRAGSLSSSEHLLLAVFLHQYNQSINSFIHGFDKIPPLVGITSNTMIRLINLLDFFDAFPLLFNGEKII